jgi:hypothetical protein
MFRTSDKTLFVIVRGRQARIAAASVAEPQSRYGAISWCQPLGSS